MNPVELCIGVVIGGIIWALLAYTVIRLLQRLEDTNTDRARNRARRYREEKSE